MCSFFSLHFIELNSNTSHLLSPDRVPQGLQKVSKILDQQNLSFPNHFKYNLSPKIRMAHIQGTVFTARSAKNKGLCNAIFVCWILKQKF